MNAKTLTLEQIVHQRAQYAATGKRIVLTNGCFDILHAGHIQYLYEAKELGDILIVGINSDQSVKGFKGDQRPIVPQDQRAAVLSALEMVD
ncbi:MAG: rfaE bifunctional protein nucleotidyltransferase chain/domain, partial [Candidatus Marinamargulisbacteria bacterium]